MAINGSFWIGGAMGAAASDLRVEPAYFAPDFGWRVAFFIGAILALGILALRASIPESPRWLVIHGQETKAEAIVGEIEAEFIKRGATLNDPKR